ncbi:adenosinetriphosphatase [Saprolegnia diclina VS20]|uniref:RNA helicase n=1 Tax=Saprolegnia diclina (strain VS20) TaxID=1156394 RepID=T0Q863_SAPDV|nr:adenosinetriphosphatase [Saprolegnia diclina VS20]EQC29660.1 adenosinetriphosphatase [Saprolegnia diclina VS20]|eukprot:XP_008616964.1 adenosinetriphosphatase [Saprolegnia diclina VS20]
MSGKRKDRTQKRRRDDDDDDETVEVGAALSAYQQRKQQQQGHGSGDEGDELDEDQRERRAFEERMRLKDEDRTRKRSGQKEESLDQAELRELATRGSVADKVRDAAIEARRAASRREFLRMRTEKMSKLVDYAVKDDALMFGDDVSKKELEKRTLQETILSIERAKARGDTIDAYQIPDASDQYDADGNRVKKTVEDFSIVERDDEGPVKTEQEIWEETQLKNARKDALYGAQDRKAEVEYELEMDDQIEFISQQMMAGHNVSTEDIKDARKRAEENQHLSMLESRKQLPIYAYREVLLEAVRDHQVIIMVGETGSGKTTQVPQYLHEVGYSEMGKIGCTQPRRVAAMSVAARVAHEMNVKLGNEVGYSIRFEDCTSEKTKVKYMTDGMLLREFLTEPDLKSYSCLIIDEAHERTLSTDILFGLIKDISRYREDLKIIIASATLDAEKFSVYFDNAPIVKIPGRMFPVDILYTRAPEADYLDAAIVTVLQIHITQPPGDILVFLTGQEEIETAEELLLFRTRGLGSRIRELLIRPIYATLPSERQAQVFETTPPNTRKVVIGTNIAETSLTIPGICYVIDAGFCKQTNYNPQTGMESLLVTPISQAMANQRAGRAGRTQPGKCFRLYTAWSYQHELDETTIPEIQRTNLGTVVLLMKSLGINDLLHFDFMDPPPEKSLIRALEQLYALGALNDRGELTKLGRRMAEFPLDPMMSKALLASEKYGVSEEVMTVCAMLSVNNTIFYRPKDKAVHADNARLNFARGGGGDHICLLNVYNQWVETNYSTQWTYENFVVMRALKTARDIREQLAGLCDRVEIEKTSNPHNTEAVRKALCAGFFYNTAKLDNSGAYKTVKQKHSVHIHPSSCLVKLEEMPRWVVFHELAFTSKEYMRQVAPIKAEWLTEIAPHYYKTKDVEDSSTKKMPKLTGRA